MFWQMSEVAVRHRSGARLDSVFLAIHAAFTGCWTPVKKLWTDRGKFNNYDKKQ
jgi:hypothetical protein